MRDRSWEPSQQEKELLLALRAAIFHLYFCLENKRVNQTPVEESLMEKGNRVIFKPQLNLWRWKSKQRQKPYIILLTFKLSRFDLALLGRNK